MYTNVNKTKIKTSKYEKKNPKYNFLDMSKRSKINEK
jgi:hypothetical protein